MKEALIVIDMVNDFAPGGKLPVPDVANIIPEVILEIKKAQRSNIPIFFVSDWHEEDDAEFKIWPPHCIKMTEGANLIPEIEKIVTNDSNNTSPFKEYIIIDKTTYDGFYKTDLELTLDGFGIEKLTIVGCVSHICILFTVSSAVLRGYEVVVPRDAVAGFDSGLTEAAFAIMEDVLGVKVI